MKNWALFWLLGFIWGSSFLLIKIAVEELGVFGLVSLRVLIASSLMMGYLLWQGYKMPQTSRELMGVLFVGIFNVALPFSLITRAEEQIDSSLATILNSTVPLFGLIIAHFVLKDERLNFNKLLGLIIGYVGVIVLTSRGLSNTGNSPIEGQVMMLMAACSYGIAVVFIRARLRSLHPFVIAGTSLLVGAICIVPLTLILGDFPNITTLDQTTLLTIVTLSVINTVIAYFIFYTLIDAWGARATMVTYTFPPIGITLGAVFLGEVVDMRLILGAILILLGIFAVNYKGNLAGRFTRRVAANL